MRFRSIVLTITGLLLTQDCLAAAGDKVNTSHKVIETIRIQEKGSEAVYYFVAKGGWNVDGCPGVIYAYLSKSSSIADATLSSALTSKTANLPITFSGTCGDGNGNMQYLQIDYVTF